MAEKATNELVYIQTSLKAPKNQRNNFGGYNYRSCEDIMEAVKPLLKETGCTLVVGDDIVQVADRIYVKATATLTTPKGMVYTNSAFAREPLSKKGMDESQVTGAASSYARKYALNGLLCIDDTKDADATNTHAEAPQKPQAQAVAIDMQSVFKEIKNAADTLTLQNIWKKYPALQSNQEFRNAWAVRRGELQAKGL